MYHELIQFDLCEMLPGRFVNSIRTGVTVDISDGGLGLVTKHPLKSGDVVKLEIPVEARHARLPIYSLIVWVTEADNHFKAGLRFLA
jgi:hypothetical protein